MLQWCIMGIKQRLSCHNVARTLPPVWPCCYTLAPPTAADPTVGGKSILCVCVCVHSCLMVNLRRFPSLSPVLWCCTLVMHPSAHGGFMGQMPNICPLCFAALSLRTLSEAVDLNCLLLLLVLALQKYSLRQHFFCSFLESSLHIGYCI